MKYQQENRIVQIRAVTVLVVASVFAGGFLYSRLTAKEAGAGYTVSAEVEADREPAVGTVKYNKFPHSKHKRRSCSSCHKFPSSNWKRVRKDPFPDITDYPKHSSCLSCHRRQFFASARPAICTICHTNPSPRNSRRHAFPNPREVFDKTAKGKNVVSQFEIAFPHEIHIGMMGENRVPVKPGSAAKSPFVEASFRKRAAEGSCSTCHQVYKPQGDSDNEYVTAPPKDLGDEFWLKKGMFQSVPTSHETCFTCHSTDSGMLPAPKDCATCHKPKPRSAATDFDRKVASPMKITDKKMLMAWRKRDSSAKFSHEFIGHVDMECASCHTVDKMNTVVAATKKVKISSCALCHVTETSDDGGILNYEVDSRKADPKFQCVKCHIAFGKLPIPATHLEAIKAQAGS